ncbi:hypothetical protein V6N13_051346 [Hibiscus sabdariffa]
MGTRTDFGYFLTGGYDGDDCSPWCESRVWQPLGHRTVSLEPPCPGVRYPGRHYRQELARRLASSGRYKVLWVVDEGCRGLEKRYSDRSVEFRCRTYTVGSKEVLWIAEAERG